MHRLHIAWQYQSESTEAVFESSPIVVDGLLYFTEAPAGVVALDATNGSLRWHYTRPVPSDVTLCCGAVNRGVAVLDSLLYLGTLDAHLVALSASEAQSCGTSRWPIGRRATALPARRSAINGKIITGVGGSNFGIRGFIAAFDAATGKERWRFWTVPAPGEPGSNTWTGKAWRHGGAATWLTGSYDPALNMLYWGVGNPSPIFNGDTRGGDNLYANSVVAIDADSGTLRWHFQLQPHDEHDWDATQIPVLIDAPFQGAPRRLLSLANRNGFYYLLDRETGKFLLARAFAKQTWAAGIDSAGRPVLVPSARPSARGTVVFPSVAGATNWWSPSLSPRTGLFYVPVLEGSSVIFAEPMSTQNRSTPARRCHRTTRNWLCARSTR